MWKFRDKLKGGISKFQKTIDDNTALLSAAPTPFDPAMSAEQDFFRYRKQRGVNLGSWFVLERWIADKPFRAAHAPGQSDLDVARGHNAKEILQEHWDSWITEEDWTYISQRGINTVRIPIGYYHVCGADRSVLDGTDFQEFYDVFEGAWARITCAIEMAHKFSLGVLIDLHAAPGKQNHDSHGGTSNPPAFFSSSKFRTQAIHVLCVLLSHLPRLPNIVGLELLNEPNPPKDEILMGWYGSAIKAVRELDPNLPVYLGECWRTQAYADFTARLPNPTGALTVLDHHLYRCFTSSDTSTSATEHARSLSSQDDATQQMLRSASTVVGPAGGGVVIGEWSGALNPGSLQGMDAREAQRRWVEAQLGAFESCTAGWFFWTYKKEGGGDTGWGWRDAIEAGVFPGWVGLRRVGKNGGEDEGRRLKKRDRLREQTLAAHTSYWSQYPGQYQHHRFAEGFTQGWDDAHAFFTSSPPTSQTSTPELGFTLAWARRRTNDHGAGYWEFEHGFVQGVGAARGEYERNYC